MSEWNGQRQQLLRMAVASVSNLVLARQRVRRLAAALGFDAPTQTRIATAATEIARFASDYSAGSALELAVETVAEGSRSGVAGQTLVITAEHPPAGTDGGAAAGESDEVAKARDLSIEGARQLMDELVVENGPESNRITMRKALSGGAPRTALELAGIQEELSAQSEGDAVEEVQVQNRELLQALEDLGARERELARVNEELTQTNSGVLALYDELETLHRVGMILAERHHLHDLLQTIIDATTELTGADVGAFYYHESSSARWRLNAMAGPQRGHLARLPVENSAGLFSDCDEPVSRIDDVAEIERGQSCTAWAELLAEFFPVRSCLFVPVRMVNSELAGALVFGHKRPGAFTERSERIVGAIAVQAAVGIEKARLFHGLQSASEAKDRFLAMLSHELRTPLNPVTAILSTMVHDPALPAHLREEVVVMRRNIELEARLIDDLLDFNRIIRGKLQLDRTPVDMHELIRAVVEICRAELEAQQHTLTLDLQAPRALVSGDSARLQQVLWNLLKNAIKFTPDGGSITIHTELAGEEALVVEVIDSGRGIGADALSSIFSAFDQGTLQPGRLGGLGLGLAIAKTFIDLHGGEISAASAGAGRGARFTLRLPLLPVPASGEASAPAGVKANAAAAGRRILLVDDHLDTLRTLARLLTRRGHQVTSATSCAEALSLAEAESFDVLISDIGLPDRSGLELVTELRRNQPIPAIALSGYGMEGDLAQSESAGFDRHITKPVDFALLEEAIAGLGAGD